MVGGRWIKKSKDLHPGASATPQEGNKSPCVFLCPIYNGHMFGDGQNLKDTQKDPVKDTFSAPVPYKKTDLIFTPYPKLSKLITALYMVTDIMDKEEPLRLQLRTLGAEILSDIHSLSRTELHKKIQIILSFMDISLAVSLVSEMNFNILKKEFNQLALSLGEIAEPAAVNHVWLEEFLESNSAQSLPQPNPLLEKERANSIPKTTSIIPNNSKKQRRDGILAVIQANGGNATIAEVKQKASGALATCGEKTLQRELISMLQDGLLTKTGEKRWSRYFISNKTLL